MRSFARSSLLVEKGALFEAWREAELRLAVILIIVAIALTPASLAAGRAESTHPATEPPSPGGMQLDLRGGRILVDRLPPGSGAARAGLREGDVLLAVNDVNLIDLEVLSPEAVVALIGEEPEVRLIVGRGGVTLGLHLSRAQLNAPAVQMSESHPPRPGDPGPGFEGIDLTGRPVRLDQLRGRPVLLDFWASWCPPCRDSAITLRRFADQFGEALVIVGVSLDVDRHAFEAFVYNHHLPGYQIHDGGPSGPITTLYGIPAVGIPFSILLSPDGQVLDIGPSLQTKEEGIARLLGPAAPGDGG